MSEARTYRAIKRGQTPDGVWHEPGDMFTTDAPEGNWMQPLDEQGRPIEKEKKAPPASAGAVDVDTLIEDARLEVRQRAQSVMDDMRKDFDEKLQAEKARADNAEKLLGEAKAEHDKLIGDADAATDKATQRAEVAEKERDSLKADLDKAKAALAKATK
ncbi:hypothetical protein [Sphingobium sp. YR657]|uniref:hypothetical protein n=1 Tax=Sphingobium sp. YR657 TaxID=1884366 RepID=UPI003137AA8E